MSRIFLSHSSHDDFEAIALRDWLASEGWDDVFLDVDPDRGVAAGERWERALYAAATRCEAVVFVVSASWLASGWCRKEYELARGLNKKLFAVLVDLSKTIADLPPELTGVWQVVDLAGGQDLKLFPTARPGSHEEKHVGLSQSGLVRLKRGLEKAGLDPKFFAWPPEREPDRAPYRGLKPLDAEDAGVFFGRDAPIVEATDRLRGLSAGVPPRLFVILGASGAGKSSFLRAGLLPRLARDDAHFVVLPSIRPERAALTGENGLIEALANAMHGRARAELREATRRGAVALRPLLAEFVKASLARRVIGDETERPPAAVIAVDQAEELFRVESKEESEALLSILGELVGGDNPAVVAIFAIRSDSYDALERAKSLEGMPQATLPLLPMPRGAYAEVIEGPARRLEDAGGRLAIEPRLTERALADIESGGGSDALPLLAFTLEQLYLDYSERGKLRLADYEEFGGLKGAINAAVARALMRADADARIPKDREARLALLRRGLIPWLAGIDPESKTPRRNIARRSDIPPEAAPLIDLLVEERLLSSDTRVERDAAGAETRVATIEPTHEALLRQWGLLAGWLKEDFSLLATLEAVKRAVGEWDANGRDAAWLAHRGQRLADAGALDERPDIAAKLDATDRAYLAGCRARETAEAAEAEARRREREEEQARAISDARQIAAANRRVAQRTRIGLVAALVLAAVATVVGGVALHLRGVATEQAAIAAREAREAETQRGAAEQAAAEASRQKDAATAAAAEADKQRQIAEQAAAEESRQKEAATEAAAEADKQRQIAEQAAAEASRQKDAATAAAAEAERQRQVAEQETARAKQQEIAAKANAEEAAKQSERATAQARLALANQDVALAALSKFALPTSPAIAAKLALAAWPRAKSDLGPKLPVALAALGDAVVELRERGVFRGHEYRVATAAFSPDGARVVTASADDTARVWDAATGQSIGVLKGHEGVVTSAAFSPEGARVVTASEDDTARVWDAATGQSIAILKGHEGWLRSAAFSPEGARVVTASEDNTARVWDATTGRTIAVLKGHEHWVTSAAFSPEGARVVTASEDNTARVWDATTGRTIAVLKGENGLDGAWFSPDGARVVTTSESGTAGVWDAATGQSILVFGIEGAGGALSLDGKRLVAFSGETARVWDTAGGRLIATLNGHKAKINGAAFSPDGARVVTASDDQTARLWDAATGERIAVFKGHDDAVHSAAFSPDGARVVTASEDHTARVWDAATVQLITALDGHTGSINSAAFSPSGARAVTASDDKTARIWDTTTGQTTAILKGHEGMVWSAAFSPDGKRIVTASDDHTARVWDAMTGRQIAVLKGHEGAVRTATFSSDGTRVVTVSDDKTARIWEAAKGRSIAILGGHDIGVFSAALSPDGARVVTASGEGTARVWDAATGRTIAVLKGHDGPVNSAAFSPDGARVVTASIDGTARVWDAATGQAIAVLKGHQHQVWSAAFSPDGARVVTASYDNTARVWDAVTGVTIAVLKGHEHWVKSAAFSPDGARLVTASDDNTARVWDAATGQPIVVFESNGDSATFSPDGARLLIGFDGYAVHVWDISLIPTGDVFHIACAWLSDRNLTDVARDYGLTNLAPICASDPPLPDPIAPANTP
jgi:WD40 repeat protein